MIAEAQSLAATAPFAPTPWISPWISRRPEEDAARDDLALWVPGAQGALVMGTCPLYSCTH